MIQACRKTHGGRGGGGCSVVEGGSEWVTTAITAGTTLIAATVGALAGYLGSARASKQAVEIARDQRRFERVHEMRAEVIPEIYGDLRMLRDRIEALVEAPIPSMLKRDQEDDDFDGKDSDPEESTETSEFDRLSDEVLEAQKKILLYYQRHLLWMPAETSNELLKVMKGLRDVIGRYFAAVREGESEQVAVVRAEVLEWFRTEGKILFNRLALSSRKVLGIDAE
jgi:hypothetical protein